MFSLLFSGSGEEVILRLDFWEIGCKKLLDQNAFVFSGLLMGVFCVGEKHHNSGTLLKYLNS